ncbi:MAG: PIN domain-containing protein [Candidatus Bathyarchaeia archaeon]
MTALQNKGSRIKVILDSNALFVPLEFKMDIFEETRRLLGRNVEFILLSPVKAELELLASADASKMRRQASFALRLAEKCNFVAVERGDQEIDDVIVEVAKNWGAVVFTNDRVLRRRLRDISVPVIYLRQKSRLDIDGLIS